MIRSDTIMRALLTLLFAYLFTLGGTWNGVLIPELKMFTLWIMAACLAGWGVLRWRRGWVWYRTPLDPAYGLWGVAIGVSLLVNDDVWRRSVMALWYLGLYLIVWVVLQDLITHKLLRRATVLDAVMFGGLIVVIFGFVQMRGATVDLAALRLPRPGSVIGNPNALGAFLVPLLVTITARFIAVRNRLARFVLGGYGLAVGLLLLATFSRGAWMGAVAALGTLCLLILQANGLLSLQGLRGWWETLPGRVRGGVIVGVVIVALVGGALLYLVIGSLDNGERSLNLRTFFYDIALDIFEEQPLTGSGLFTFGREFALYQSLPPRQPHSHPHSGLLLVAAELGILGLLALGGTAMLLGMAVYRNWQQVPARQRVELAGSIAAVVGFAVHHLIDTPAMMPLIALLGVLMLALATAPFEPQPITAQWRRIGHPVVMASIAVVLVVSGFWSTSIYQRYNNTLTGVFNQDEDQRDYRAAAEQLDAIVEADPNMAIYHNQQAYLYGLAAYKGDATALESGIKAYTRFLDLEPYNAVGWTNLAGLYAQAGEWGAAVESMQEATRLAPSSWQLWWNLGTFAEAAGQDEIARTAYTRALSNTTALYSAWDDTPLRQDVHAGFDDYSGHYAQVAAILNGEPLPESVQATGTTEADYVTLLLYDLTFEPVTSQAELDGLLDDARAVAESAKELAWVNLGEAVLTQMRGDAATARYKFDQVDAYLTPEFGEEDFVFGANIAHFQFLRFAVPRQFLPQVEYPYADVTLMRLKGHFDQ